MQTVITHTQIVSPSILRTAVPDASPSVPSLGRRAAKTFARTWDLVGVIAVMGSSAAYAVGHLMTLAR